MKMDSNDVVIVSAVRSAIGSYGGQFRTMTNVPLGVPVMTEAIKRAGIDPAIIDDIGWGCCYQRAHNEANVARVTAIKSGVPDTVPASVSTWMLLRGSIWPSSPIVARIISSGTTPPCKSSPR